VPVEVFAPALAILNGVNGASPERQRGEKNFVSAD
jgi:hypothetical protein